jgi:hypothetical protein
MKNKESSNMTKIRFSGIGFLLLILNQGCGNQIRGEDTSARDTSKAASADTSTPTPAPSGSYLRSCVDCGLWQVASGKIPPWLICGCQDNGFFGTGLQKRHWCAMLPLDAGLTTTCKPNSIRDRNGFLYCDSATLGNNWHGADLDVWHNGQYTDCDPTDTKSNACSKCATDGFDYKPNEQL